MSKLEMMYAATAAISLVSLTVYGTVLWERNEQNYKRRKRAKLQRVADRVQRHKEMRKYNCAVKELLK